MVCCSAYGCSNRSDRNKDKHKKERITFHKFPKNAERREKWIQAVRRADWTPSENSVLCSAHFSRDCFNLYSHAIRRLEWDAIPTIFPAFPAYLQQKQVKARGTADQKRKVAGSAAKHRQSTPATDPQPSTSADEPQPTSMDVRDPQCDTPLLSLSRKQLVPKTTSG